MIDILGMLREKTRGNLDAGEEQAHRRYSFRPENEICGGCEEEIGAFDELEKHLEWKRRHKRGPVGRFGFAGGRPGHQRQLSIGYRPAER